MKSIELEGSLADVQDQIRQLPYDSNTQVRVRIDEAIPEREAIDFVPTEFENGVPLLPRNRGGEPITLELIQRILDEEDEEIIRRAR